MLPYIDGMYSVYYTAGRIARKISRPAAGRIDTAIYIYIRSSDMERLQLIKDKG